MVIYALVMEAERNANMKDALRHHNHMVCAKHMVVVLVASFLIVVKAVKVGDCVVLMAGENDVMRLAVKKALSAAIFVLRMEVS